MNIIEPNDLRSFLSNRKQSFLESLRKDGLNSDSASFLRQSVRESPGSPALYLDSEGVEGDSDDESEMTITRTISTPTIDRYGDSVIPRGCEKSLSRFLANPAVFWGHKSADIPIATALDVKVFDDRIVSKAKFHCETEESRVVWKLRKILKSTSIGFLPVKASIIGSNKSEDEKEEEYRKKRKDKTPNGEKVITFDSWCPLRFLEWELLEWSVVGIAANPDCVESLTKYLSDGVVEGEKIPLSLHKSLEPYTHKGRVWVHGFDPSKEKHTGTVECGGHTLEFDAGKITKIDTISISSDLDNPIPVPNPADDNPPGMKAPGQPLLNKKEPIYSSIKGLLFKDVKAGEQDSLNPQLLGVPDVVQKDHYSCGAASAMSVGRFFGVGPDSLEEWKKLCGTTEEQSTHPLAIEKCLKDLGLTVECRYEMSLEDLGQHWHDGHPVICCVQDYGPFIPEAAEFDYGHYLTVIGCAFGKVFCQDSSADNVTRGSDSIQEDGRIMVDEAKWLQVWHDKDAEGNEYKQFGIIVCMGDNDIAPRKSIVTKSEPAKPGTDTTNLDTVHAAILGVGDVLKKIQEQQEVSWAYHKEQHHEKLMKVLTDIHSKMVGQPKEDEKEDLKPGDPNYHDPNATIIPSASSSSPEYKEILEALSSLSSAYKKQGELLFSITGKQV